MERADPGEPGVGRREEGADVAQAGSAENRVDDRMGEDVPVGVAGEPPLRVELDSAEDELHPGLERMGVDARPDPVLSQAAPAGLACPRRR